jgi:hypothetical protein
MGRPLRVAPGGLVYHVLNRANGRMTLFDDDGDYAAFARVLAQACERVSMRLVGVLYEGDDQTARRVGWKILALIHGRSISPQMDGAMT